MRILFMGTPQFAVPSLNALMEAGHALCGVFTQPDKPKNRGMKLQFSPVKELALTHGIPVFQPAKLRDGTALARVEALAPELIVVAAYGRILPKEILDFPAYGCINVHSSLLPKYRGAAPINWAVLNGEAETGVTIMHMVQALDAGDIIAQRSTPIGPDENAEELCGRLAELGAGLLVETVDELRAGTASRVPQDESEATLAPMLSREMSPVDWSRSAREIFNHLRGLYPWPGASTTVLTGEPVKLWGAQVVEKRADARPGSILKADAQGIDIVCGDGQVLRILELQPSGKKRMAAAAFLAGHPIKTQ